jgi:ribonuclease D
MQELSLIEDLSPKTLRKEGDAVLAMVKQAQAIAPDDWPAALPRPLPLQAGSLLKNLKALAVQRATELAMPQEMLVRKKDYEVLLRDRVLPATLEGWRKDIIGDELLVMVLA